LANSNHLENRKETAIKASELNCILILKRACNLLPDESILSLTGKFGFPRERRLYDALTGMITAFLAQNYKLLQF
jgi:NAD(P)H-hydrate repair Nnr-like enzyme with NAD(P)H-hydrate dehydratase domain